MNKQGIWGETQAADFLAHRGYQIVARNYKGVGGEIDIVAQLKKMLVFVEVKQRSYAENQKNRLLLQMRFSAI